MTDQPYDLQSEYMARQWSAIDLSTDPRAFIGYLDAVAGLETIRRVKQLTYELLQVREGHRILDTGCGLGDDVRALAQRVGASGRVVGVDCSEVMLAEARKRLAGLNLPVELYVGDSEDLRFPANTFDGCRAERLFVHLRRPERALAEMVRVARAGARVVVFDVDWETLAVDAPDRATTRKLLNFHCDSGGSRWIGRQLRRLFSESGLVEIGVIAETFIFTDYPQAERVFQLQETALHAQAAGAVSPAQAEQWLNDLELAQQHGSFFAAATGFCVSGRKP